MEDYFTKFTEIYPIPNIDAETVADVILRGWTKRYGCPVEIHSHQGTQYESQLFQGACILLRISKSRTTAAHPSSDGMVEWANRTITEMLAKYIQRNQSDWDSFIDYIVMAYNATPHASTGISLYEVVFGEKIENAIKCYSGMDFG